MFTVAVIFFFMNHLNNEIFTELQSNINTSDTNYTEAVDALQKIKTTDRVVWDYAFLGVFMGVLIVLGLTAYAVRISPIFYWIYVIMGLVVLATGVILSNIWQDMATDPEFATTLTYFPITDAVLGSYYPMVVVVIILVSIIILFGKPTGREGYY